jgi:hypothetical protein
MRATILLTGVLAIVATATLAQIGTPTFWTPTHEQIAAFEERITPVDFKTRYARYYAGLNYGAVRFHSETFPDLFIQAQFIPLEPGEVTSVHILKGAKLPTLKGEGCVAGIQISPQPTQRPIELRCTAPGGWTPSEAEIADLERGLVLPARAFSLERYSRHYAGITTDGTPVIQAVFVAGIFGYSPGIFIVSDVELPTISDGGCYVIMFRYDPVTKRPDHVACNGVA